jgi:hypothetical protein
MIGFNLRSIDPSNPLSSLTEEQRNKYDEYTELRNYYKGVTTKWLKQDIARDGTVTDDNVNINLAKRVVNKGNNLLFGKGLTWQIDSLRTTPEEQVLDSIWGGLERRNMFLTELGVSGGIYGDVYIQILVDKNGNISLKSLKPSSVFITPNDYDDDADLFDIRWSKLGRNYRLLHYRNDNDTWDYLTEVWERNKWVSYIEPVTWNYDWAFITHGKNLPNPHTYYGLSDLDDIEINDTINQVASNMNKVIRLFAHPVIWGTGFAKSDLDTSAVLMSSNPQAKLEALQLANALGDTQTFFKTLKSITAEITGIPESDPEILNIGTKSGFALEVLLNDAILKTGVKRNFYGATIIETNRRLAELSGFSNDVTTKLFWANPLPKDVREQIEEDTFALENKLVSKKTIATKIGYDYEAEQEQIRQESTSNLLPFFPGE